MNQQHAQIIQAIASLWPLALVASSTFLAWLFRRQIASLIERNRGIQFERGNVKVTLEQGDRPKEIPPRSDQIAEPKVDEDSRQDIDDIPNVSDGSDSEKDLVIELLEAGNFEAADVEFSKRLSEEGDEVTRLRRQIVYQYVRYVNGDTSALAALQRLAESHHVIKGEAFRFIGLCYEHGSDYLRAAEAFAKASDSLSDPETRAKTLVALARSLQHVGRADDGIQTIGKGLADKSLAQCASVLYDGLAALFGREENDEMQAIAVLKEAEQRPNDPESRFQAAFALGKAELPELSLYHYETLLTFKSDHQWALNNLGVQFNRLSLPSHAADAFEAAWGHGNTLAAANLASMLIDAGVIHKGREILDRARLLPDVHPNVGHYLAEASRMVEEEDSKLAIARRNGLQQSNFLSGFAAARFTYSTEAIPIDGTWQDPNGNRMSVRSNGEEIIFDWAEGDDRNRIIANALNRGLRGEVHRVIVIADQEVAPSIPIGRGFLYVSENGEVLHRFTELYSRERTISSFRRVHIAEITAAEAPPSLIES